VGEKNIKAVTLPPGEVQSVWGVSGHIRRTRESRVARQGVGLATPRARGATKVHVESVAVAGVGPGDSRNAWAFSGVRLTVE